MGKKPLFIIEDSFNYSTGDLIKNYTEVSDGIITETNDFIPKQSFILLQEKLSSDDEKRVKEIIKQQLKIVFWNLYTKQSIIVGS